MQVDKCKFVASYSDICPSSNKLYSLLVRFTRIDATRHIFLLLKEKLDVLFNGSSSSHLDLSAKVLFSVLKDVFFFVDQRQTLFVKELINKLFGQHEQRKQKKKWERKTQNYSNYSCRKWIDMNFAVCLAMWNRILGSLSGVEYM